MPRRQSHQPTPLPQLTRPATVLSRRAAMELPLPVHRRVMVGPRGLSRRMMGGSPGRFLHPTKSCGRSKHQRPRMGPGTAVSTWRPRPGLRCSRRATVWWCSPGGWSTATSSPSITTPGCAPRTSPWCRQWRPGCGFVVANRSGCSPPDTLGAPLPRACIGACGATGCTWSRCGSSARRGCGCSRWNPRAPQTSATSRSFARRRRTARVCSWQTRDSVTPRTRPISARVRFSK